MKLQRSTLILMLVALSLGTVVYLTQVPGTREEEIASDGKEKLFSFQADDIQSITLKMPEQTLIFERRAIPVVPDPVKEDDSQDATNKRETDGEKTAEGKESVDGSEDRAEAEDKESGPTDTGSAIASNWLLKAPVQGPANDAYVSYLTNLLVTGGRDRALEISPDQLSEYGLDKPQATVEIRLKSQQTHTLQLGSANFDRTSLYAQIDPAQETPETLTVLLVGSDFENAVNRSLSEWQAQKDEEPDTQDEG